MAWDQILDQALDPNQQARKRTFSGFLGTLSDSMRRAQMTPEQAMAVRLNPLRAEGMRLQNELYGSQLDDLTRERAERAAAPQAARNVLDAYAAKPGGYDVAPQPTGQLQAGEDEEAGAFIGATPGQGPREARPTARTLTELLARLKNPEDFETAAKHRPETVRSLGLKTPEEIEKLDTETVTVPRGSTVIRKKSGEQIATGKPAVKTELKAGKDGYYYAIAIDEDGNVVGSNRTDVEAQGSKGVYTREDIEDQIDLENAQRRIDGKPVMNALEKRQRYNDLARWAALAPGGGLVGAGSGMQPPPTTQGPAPNVSGAQKPGGHMLATRPATPSSDERADLAELDAAETQLQTVLDSLKSGKLGPVTGGVFKNPQGALNRKTEEYLGFGMNDEQRKLISTLEIQLQAIKHALIGATRTRPELADIAAAIPDAKSLLTGDTDEQMIPKLEATLQDLRTKRGTREGAMRGSGVAVPPRPSGSEAPKATPSTTFDTLPPAAQFKGRVVRNPQNGLRMKSDGQQWVPVP